MEKYPLAPLLKVREYREDAAKNALSAAERAVVEAQEAVERCRGELERYKVWRQEEVERRYDAIMGKGLSLKELDVFKAGLGALADGELKLEEAIAQALENVKKRQEDVRKAREAARQAQHETAKIVTHRDIWLVEAKREAERLEDLEMEAITAARVANEERLVSAPDMWEWQKCSRLNGVSLTEWELFAERVRGRFLEFL